MCVSCPLSHISVGIIYPSPGEWLCDGGSRAVGQRVLLPAQAAWKRSPAAPCSAGPSPVWRSLEAEPTQGAWRVRRGLFAKVPMGGCETLCFAYLLGQSQLRAKGWVSVLPRSGKAEEWEKVYVLLHPWEVMGGDG